MSAGHHLVDAITEPGRPETQEVADGVFAYIQPDGTWWINNTGFLVGPQGVISIDACSTERRTRAYRHAIEAVTAAPVRTLVNTHHHGDHTFGNCLFPGATIVGHERAREEVIAFGPPRELPFWDHGEWGDLTLDPPFLTFTDSVTVHAGDLRAELRHVGTAAHTTNDVIAWLPEQSVLFCGDLVFNGGTPFLLMGSVSGAIEVLEDVVAPLGAATVVPGHGPVFSGDEPIRATLDYRASCSTSRSGDSRPGSARSTRPATPTSVGSPTGPTPSASWATCTARTPSWATPRAAAPSTSSPRSATWSPTTAGAP
jgi:cyclase